MIIPSSNSLQEYNGCQLDLTNGCERRVVFLIGEGLQIKGCLHLQNKNMILIFFHAHRGHACLVIERYHTGIQLHTCGGRYGDVCNNYTLQRNNRHLVSLMRTTERWHSSLQLHKCGGKYQNGSTHVEAYLEKAAVL